MTTMEEFTFIASQLEWLEGHVRESIGDTPDGRMRGALDSLACARAVMLQLAHIGAGVHVEATEPAFAQGS